MKIKNVILALKDQLPIRRMVKNILNNNILGVFIASSHTNKNSTLKIMYGHKESANKAATAMEKKTGNKFSSYKCIFCDGFHIGKDPK